MKRARDLSCRDVVALLDDYLDGQLTPSQRAAVAAHLEACIDCATYMQRARIVLTALGTAPRADALAAAQLLRLREALHLGRT